MGISLKAVRPFFNTLNMGIENRDILKDNFKIFKMSR